MDFCLNIWLTPNLATLNVHSKLKLRAFMSFYIEVFSATIIKKIIIDSWKVVESFIDN